MPLRTASYPGSRPFKSEDGRFVWNDVAAGTWSITANAPSYQPREFPAVSIPSGQLSEEFLISLAKGQELQGRVFDAATGQGISSALIECIDAAVPFNRTHTIERRSVLTNGAGFFEIDGLPSGRKSFEVRASGYAPKILEIDVGLDHRADIGLSAGASIGGRVVDEDGSTPVAGMIRLWSPTSASGSSVPSDHDGRFVLANIPAGRYLIRASSEAGYSSERSIVLTADQRVTDLVLRLEAGGTIQGKVAGLLPGEYGKTLVHVSREPDIYLWALVNEQGLYSIRGVPPGEARVTLQSPLQRGLAKSVELGAQDAVTVNFELPNGSRLLGRVMRNGRPAPFVIVTAKAVDGQPFSAEGETGQSGQYRIEGLGRGNYIVSAQPTHSKGAKVEHIYISEDTLLNIELSAIRVAGTVVDALSTEPLANTSLELTLAKSGKVSVLQKTTSNYKGGFSLVGLEPGEYTLTAYKAAHDIDIRHIVVAGSINDLSIALRPTHGTDIRVRDAVTGLPLRSVFVSAANGDAEVARLELPLDERGVGNLPPSLAGRDVLIAWHGYQSATVRAWNGSPLDLTLTAQD